MKFKTSHTIEQEHEIELPHYRTIPSGHYFYKIIDENTCIMICQGTTMCCGIEISTTNQAFLQSDNFETTKEAFDEAYEKQLSILNSLK